MSPFFIFNIGRDLEVLSLLLHGTLEMTCLTSDVVGKIVEQQDRDAPIGW